MLNRISDWMGGRGRRTKKAARDLSAFLLMLAAMSPPRKHRFVAFTLRQRQPHLAFLLRRLDLDDEATAVEGLDWTESEAATGRTSGLAARRRFERAYKVFSQVGDAAIKIVGDKQTRTGKAEEVAAGAAYAEAALSIKHSWRTQAKFWKDIEAGRVERLTDEEAAASNPTHEALRDAVAQVYFLIRMKATVDGSNEDYINREIQAAIAEQVAWILSPSP